MRYFENFQIKGMVVIDYLNMILLGDFEDLLFHLSPTFSFVIVSSKVLDIP